jgi:hypothetical protein
LAAYGSGDAAGASAVRGGAQLRVLAPHGGELPDCAGVDAVATLVDGKAHAASCARWCSTPAGYPDVRDSFLSPLEHETRYSEHMLSEALRLAGLTPVPLRDCDWEGRYVRRDPAELRDEYRGCPETTLVFDPSHVIRIDSLIVDGIKPGAGAAERG